MGKDYDLYFEWSNEKIYCSELVWKIYKEGAGIEIGELEELSSFDLTNEIVKRKMKEPQSLHVVKSSLPVLCLPASQSLQSVVLTLPVATVLFPPRQFSHFRLAGKMLYIPRLQSVQIPAELPTFPAGQSSQPIPSKYIRFGHLPLQLISSFSTVVKEDEEFAGH